MIFWPFSPRDNAATIMYKFLFDETLWGERHTFVLGVLC